MATSQAVPPTFTVLPTLLGIPLEVRRLILRYVFVRDRVGIPANSSIFCSPRSSQLLRCSRQLYDEGLPLLMEENTFHYIINPDHEEYSSKSVIGENAAMIKKIEMYHSISHELLSKHTSTTHFTVNLTASFPHKTTDVADDRRQTAHYIIFACWFTAMREQLCRLWFESGWFKSINDIKIRVFHESGPVPPKQTVHEYTLKTLQDYSSALQTNVNNVLERRGVKVPEELRPGDPVRWGEQVELPSTESLLETLRSLNPDLD